MREKHRQRAPSGLSCPAECGKTFHDSHLRTHNTRGAEISRDLRHQRRTTLQYTRDFKKSKAAAINFHH